MQDYNRIAGQSIERLAALSDGVFAVAMTLLVLDLKTPAGSVIRSDLDLVGALAGLLPSLLCYLMSFVLLGIFWVGQQTQLNHLSRGDRELAWIHLAFLFFVSLVPFSTGLMAEHIHLRLALLVYWLNILALGAVLFVAWCHCESAGLLGEDFDRERSLAIKKRILLAQSLYAAGALLGLVDTVLALVVILLVQLNFAIAPRWRRQNGDPDKLDKI